MPNNFNRLRRGSDRFVRESVKVTRATLAKQVRVIDKAARSVAQDRSATADSPAFGGGGGSGGGSGSQLD